MSMGKKALLFVESGVIKVVFGTSLKCIKIEDVFLNHNKAFLDRLFAEHDVLVLQSADYMTREDVDQLATPEEEPQPEYEEAYEEEAYDPFPEVEMPPARPRQFRQPAPQQRQARPRQAIANQQQRRPAQPQRRPVYDEPVDSGLWIRSNSQVAIIVDDIPTGGEFSPGQPRKLVVPGNRAIDLACLDQAFVQKSQILKRLLQNGTFSRCSAGEASEIERYNNQRAARDQERDNTMRDKQLNNMMVPQGMSAEAWAMGIREADGTIEISENDRDEYDPTMELARSLRTTREMPVQQQQEPVAGRQWEPRQLERRPDPVSAGVDPDLMGLKAQGFRKAHR